MIQTNIDQFKLKLFQQIWCPIKFGRDINRMKKFTKNE